MKIVLDEDKARIVEEDCPSVNDRIYSLTTLRDLNMDSVTYRFIISEKVGGESV